MPTPSSLATPILASNSVISEDVICEKIYTSNSSSILNYCKKRYKLVAYKSTVYTVGEGGGDGTEEAFL